MEKYKQKFRGYSTKFYSNNSFNPFNANYIKTVRYQLRSIFLAQYVIEYEPITKRRGKDDAYYENDKLLYINCLSENAFQGLLPHMQQITSVAVN